MSDPDRPGPAPARYVVASDRYGLHPVGRVVTAAMCGGAANLAELVRRGLVAVEPAPESPSPAE